MIHPVLNRRQLFALTCALGATLLLPRHSVAAPAQVYTHPFL